MVRLTTRKDPSMRFSVAFFNCGRRPGKGKRKDWDAIASTLQQAVENDPHLVGLCEVYDREIVPEVVAALSSRTGRKYHPLFSPALPRAPRLGILVDDGLGRLQGVGDDRAFRHENDWRRWLAGRVELFRPGNSSPPLRTLVIIVNHWDSMAPGRRDTMANREILAWEVGHWMCSTRGRQVLADDMGRPVPVYRQPSLALGDFNCEPGSPELRSPRKFTLQAMRNEPHRWPWPESKLERDAHALLYDLSWRRLTTSPAAAVSGTFASDDLHSPAMLDRILVSQTLWNGPEMRITLDGDGQAMRIIPPAGGCSDHCAIAITVETK
ncbi:MAG: endonuclease/exonuclease/phosphatase family protein [Thermoguttaceae bacterium]